MPSGEACLLDSNILLRISKSDDPQHAAIPGPPACLKPRALGIEQVGLRGVVASHGVQPVVHFRLVRTKKIETPKLRKGVSSSRRANRR
jgi:hypothetical protein